MAVRAEIFEEHERWATGLGVSMVLHLGLSLAIVFTTWFQFHHSGENWGGDTSGGGGAMSATLVSTVPLPHPPVETENVLANDSKGLADSIPAPVVQLPPDAIPIPDKQVKQKTTPKPAPPHPDNKKKPVEEAKNNVVPYGEGGPVSSMYANSGTSFDMGNTKGGVAMGAGGDFGSRFSWYVDAVRRKITENWERYSIDPHTPPGKRTYLTFDINRDGSPSNVRVEQSSGIPSLDISAQRALQRIDTFGPLPPDYSGNHVSVEFWFEK